MRWFPDPLRGYSPILPAKQECAPSNLVFDSLSNAALVGLPLGACCHLLDYFLERPRRGYILRITAWIALVNGSQSLMFEWAVRQKIRHRAAQGLPVPPAPYFTERDRYTNDDSRLLGGALGLITASILSRRRPVLTVSWQRALGAGCIGSLAGHIGYFPFTTVEARAKDDEVGKKQTALYSAILWSRAEFLSQKAEPGKEDGQGDWKRI